MNKILSLDEISRFLKIFFRGLTYKKNPNNPLYSRP